MSTLTINISGLSDESLKRFDEKARIHGRKREDYVRDLIERDLELPDTKQPLSILELFAPVQEEYKQSGMTDSELEDLIEHAREQVANELRADRVA